MLKISRCTETRKKKRPQKKMTYEQKRFHSADTKYYADLNQICSYLKFE